MREEAVRAIHDAYKIEEECLREMQEYIDDDAYSRAVALLAAAPRIGTCGCGHS